MVRNIVVIGGSSHPQLTEQICNHLGIPQANVLLDKFSVGETRVEIKESVRGKDVYIIQSSCGKVNDNFMELLIAISACQTASAKQVTAVLPLFPYSRQSELPYNKTGAPLTKAPNSQGGQDFPYKSDSTSQTPHVDVPPTLGLANGDEHLHKMLAKAQLEEPNSVPSSPRTSAHYSAFVNGQRKRSDTVDSGRSSLDSHKQHHSTTTNGTSQNGKPQEELKGYMFHPQPGYKPWVVPAGRLVADLLTCAGADHVITMDLHDAQYQGFFDIPVDNLYGRAKLRKYIKDEIPDYKEAVVVSPDAGGAKRATAIADGLGMPFALIHKERRPTKITDRQNATMMLVGDVKDRVTILIDDLADTSNTITRAAKLLKKEGATKVIALLTHGILSGDAIDRINNSYLDEVVVTNSVPQEEHEKRCPKLKVLEIGSVFAEAIRRVHHGESISALFEYDPIRPT